MSRQWRVAARITTTVVLAAATASTALVATNGTAHAAWGRGAGYVWAHSPTEPFYTPIGTYQTNTSVLFQAVNTVTRTGVGQYRVTYPNIGATGGVAHATAYGSDSSQCKVGSWGANPNGGQDVHVHCFNLAGQAVDTLFTTSFTNDTRVEPGRAFAHVWANDPTNPSYRPDLTYQFNSSWAHNWITRTDVGTYTVELPNLAASAGHVQVTGYGYGQERCKVAGWGPGGSSQFVTVRCHSLGGAPVDTYFTLTYVNDMNILNQHVCCDTFGHPTAYVWAFDPTSASYDAHSAYSFHNGALTGTRGDVGQYAMKFQFNFLSEGNVAVTAYGWGPEYCKVNYWNSVDGIVVRCFDRYGGPTDTLWDAAHTGSLKIG